MKNTVVLTGSLDVLGTRAIEALRAHGLNALPYDGDLSRSSSLEAFLADKADDLKGVVHFLPLPRPMSLEETDTQAWQNAFEQGALASLCAAQATCAHMASHGGGALVFVGTIHAEKPMGYGYLHSMACAATQMLAREAATQFGASGVSAYYVMRGPLKEEEHLSSPITNVYCRPDLRYPVRDYPDPDDLFPLIEFLLTPSARVLNGASLNADAGYTLYYGQKRETQV